MIVIYPLIGQENVKNDTEFGVWKDVRVQNNVNKEIGRHMRLRYHHLWT